MNCSKKLHRNWDCFDWDYGLPCSAASASPFPLTNVHSLANVSLFRKRRINVQIERVLVAGEYPTAVASVYRELDIRSYTKRLRPLLKSTHNIN